MIYEAHPPIAFPLIANLSIALAAGGLCKFCGRAQVSGLSAVESCISDLCWSLEFEFDILEVGTTRCMAITQKLPR